MALTGSSGRELTPEQHQQVRRQIALIPLYVWLIYAWYVFFTHLPVPPFNSTTHITRDFVHFYAQGAIARAHDGHTLYDIDAMADFTQRIVPAPVEVRFPPVYGPQVAMLLMPLAWMPYVAALMTTLVLTIVTTLGCVYVLWRRADHLREHWLAVTLFTLAAPGLHFTLQFGQVSVLALLCFTALWIGLRDGRPFLAGLAVGALAYKPQLGIVAAFVFVLGREWRVVAGAVIGVALQAIAAVAYWGPAIFGGYLHALRQLPGVLGGMEPDMALMHSWRSFFLGLHVPQSAAWVLALVASAVAIAAAVRCWVRGGDLAPRYGVLVLATLLVNPHVFGYDLLLLVPALLVVWNWSYSLGNRSIADSFPALRSVRGVTVATAVQALLLAVYSAPLLSLGLTLIPVQWSVVAFVILGVFLMATAGGAAAPINGAARAAREVN